jgi:hopanoid-associated phosphorylase
VVAVSGLAFEAAIVGGLTILGPELRAGNRLSEEIARGGRGIISIGVGGGLAEGLSPGQWIVGESVVHGTECHRADESWSRRMLRALPGARYGIIAGLDAPLADPRHKRELHARTGALLVDTETHHVARIAAAHDVPFAACRVVIDPAHRRLPPSALIQLLPDGRPDLAAILRSVLRRPGQLPTLGLLAAEAAMARASLRRARLLLGADLGFPYVHDHDLAHEGAAAAELTAPATLGGVEVEPA